MQFARSPRWEDDDEEDSLDEEDRRVSEFEKRGYILSAPRLQRLAVRDLFVTRGPGYLDLLLRPLPLLTHLDLTGLGHNEGLGDFSFLRPLSCLASLVLHNVLGVDSAVDALSSLRSLRHLDISHVSKHCSPIK